MYSNADPLPGDGGYKLIVASNRDELFGRPAKSAAEWEEDRSIVGGEYKKCPYKNI